jgi:16S rRNA (uracil1498-N3)-methyltransferase
MRANYKMQRLFVPHDLTAGFSVDADPDQAHYLLHVLRLTEGAELLVFNGRDGEWLARRRGQVQESGTTGGHQANPATIADA